LRQAAGLRRDGYTHGAFQEAMTAAAEFTMWLLASIEPEEHDGLISEMFVDTAAAYLDGRRGNLSHTFEPEDIGSGDKPMSVAEVRYRAFTGLSSLVMSNTAKGKRIGVQACDQLVADAVAWVDDDEELARRLGGSLTRNTVRNARLKIAAGKGDIAVFARGIPLAGMTFEQAGWLLEQVASRKGAAFGN
jgi:hypothetical protein